MKFENIKVYNFEGAFRGMRNPKNSWGKSDSYNKINEYWEDKSNPGDFSYSNIYGVMGPLEFVVGPNDMKLAQTLIKAGPEHRKFMRQIFVSVDITAPLYWWKEFDTYKVGTVANSTSTMHTLANHAITLDCFEIDDFNAIDYPEAEQREDLKYPIDPCFVQMCLIPYLEYLRQQYMATKDKKIWKELIRWLPESWLQTRTVTMSYETLLAMCGKGQRRFHKLNEWSGQDHPANENFISFARNLPYAQELIFIDELDTENKD